MTVITVASAVAVVVSVVVARTTGALVTMSIVIFMVAAESVPLIPFLTVVASPLSIAILVVMSSVVPVLAMPSLALLALSLFCRQGLLELIKAVHPGSDGAAAVRIARSWLLSLNTVRLRHRTKISCREHVHKIGLG